MMKEKKSGLFKKEEVLSLATETEEIEDDVDILTWSQQSIDNFILEIMHYVFLYIISFIINRWNVALL